ncbi:MAG: hypothetical protein J6S77_04995 [Clostridia bacterium]|nr:hypothetical protein [Clostridia bacterium]
MKKIISVCLALAMLAAMTVMMIPTASAAWDGSSVSAGLVGSGTEFDPYLISSENDLAFVAKQVNEAVASYEGEYLKLTVDLDLGNKLWTPIGVAKNYFRGTFDGDGHTISNLNVKIDPADSAATNAGLFGRICDGGVKNLTIDGAKVYSSKYAGIVCGVLSCTAKTGSVFVENCHVINAEAYGEQVAGIAGRSATTGAIKGQISITGCSVDSLYLAQVSQSDYPDHNPKNHYVGGISGCAGATVIDGCLVKNFTVDTIGTSLSTVGGIVGCQGASSVATDVTNCYVSGAKFTASADSHAEKTCLGGLIGKAAHVAVMVGDSNTEYNVFNCFVSDVNLTNGTASIRNGVVIGWVADTILFNDIYYVPSGSLPSFGEDTYFNEWPFAVINAPSELTAEKLNKGNSTAVWVDDVVLGHPTINVEAALANAPTFVDYYVENAEETTAEETTAAPETQAPETQAPETQAPETTVEETQAPETQAPETKAPAQTEAPKAEGGCGGMIAGGVVVVALLGTALVFKKRN